MPANVLEELHWAPMDTLQYTQSRRRITLYKNEIAASQPLFIHCFHHFSIDYGNQELIIKNKKLKELLAYLCANNNSWISKWSIAQQMWPDVSKSKAMDCLYKVIGSFCKTSILYSVIPFETHRERIRVCLSAQELDYEMFELLAHDDDSEALFRALDLDRGGFLENECYEWSVQQQMKYEILYEYILKQIKAL